MAWHIVKQGGDGENYGLAHKEIMLDEASDIMNEPTDQGNIATGSIAYLPGITRLWQKDAQGNWVEI